MTTLTPHAARLHRLAAFITENDLPPADLSIHADGGIVSINFHTTEHGENGLRRWAQALGFVVGTQPYQDAQGCASELLYAEGHLDGVYYSAAWARPVVASVPA